MQARPNTRAEALAREAHVWLASDRVEAADRADLVALLDPHENERYRGFRFEADRIRFLAAHALLRTCLSRYADREPGEWSFVTTDTGRPELAGVGDPSWLRFSLSHTRGLVACAIGRHLDCGVDVEEIRSLDLLDDLSRRVLGEEERAALFRLQGAERLERFFTLWTLKEAYLKARGVGMRLPLGEIDIDLTAETPALRLAAGSSDRAADWQLEAGSPTATHRLGVALRRAGRPALTVRARWARHGLVPV
jgi:4'-phosphopantetheinyl transferase